jgi:para-aminobenzoate synthetase component 2
LSVDATTGGLIMAMHHESLPIWGVQFHPESVLTASGHRMIANWLNMAGYAVDLGLVDRLVSEMDAVRHALPRA